MKNIKALTLGAAVAAALAGSMVSTSAVAGLSANLGIASQYYYRGAQQTTGAAAQAGVDYEHESGAYAGVWASDVGGQSTTIGAAPGIETDYYFGYGGEMSGITYGVGYTLYTYTGDFDTQYGEVNLTGAYGPVSLEFSTGTHDGAGADADDDYTFIALSYEYGSFTATYGTYGNDHDGAYLEIGFAKEISELDFGISLINGDPDDSVTATNATTDGTALVVTIGKTFDL